jgi:hypothetical protein
MSVDSLREAILSDDISDSLVLVKRSSVDNSELFHKELSKFDDKCKCIEDSITNQTILIDKFKSLWKETQEVLSPHSLDSTEKQFSSNYADALGEGKKLEDSVRLVEGDVKALTDEILLLREKCDNFFRERESEQAQLIRKIQIADAEKDQLYLLEKLRLKSTAKTSDHDINNQKNHQNQPIAHLPEPTPQENNNTTLEPSLLD